MPSSSPDRITRICRWVERPPVLGVPGAARGSGGGPVRWSSSALLPGEGRGLVVGGGARGRRAACGGPWHVRSVRNRWSESAKLPRARRRSSRAGGAPGPRRGRPGRGAASSRPAAAGPSSVARESAGSRLRLHPALALERRDLPADAGQVEVQSVGEGGGAGAGRARRGVPSRPAAGSSTRAPVRPRARPCAAPLSVRTSRPSSRATLSIGADTAVPLRCQGAWLLQACNLLSTGLFRDLSAVTGLTRRSRPEGPGGSAVPAYCCTRNHLWRTPCPPSPPTP